MKIDSASSSPSLAQRQLMTRTPDQDFQRDFQAAYARLAVAAEGSAEQAGALADTLGATQLEYSRVRGVSLKTSCASPMCSTAPAKTTRNWTPAASSPAWAPTTCRRCSATWAWPSRSGSRR